MTGVVAYISGGTSGINLGIARRLADLGATVLVFGRNEAKALAAAESINLAGGGRAMGAAADVRDAAAVETLFEESVRRLGRPNIVIAGAAGNFMAPAVSLSPNAFKTVVDIDLLGTFNVFRAGFSHLVKPNGVLLAISAPQGTTAVPFQAHVCAAKAGVNMLVKCLAMEWGPAGVRVNAISPGPIAGTEGVERMAPEADAKRAWASRIPIRTLGCVEDIAAAASFLVSPQARYITGAVLDCDGGWRLGDASVDCLSMGTRAGRS